MNARFSTTLRNPSMSSSLNDGSSLNSGRRIPDFSNYEILVSEALEAELEEKIEFSINMGDEVFEDVQPRMTISTRCSIDGVIKTTTEPPTDEFGDSILAFFTPSPAALLGIKILITFAKQMI